MANPGLGVKSYLQFGRETTWGTGVAATKRLPFLRQSVKTVMKQVKDLSLDGTYTARSIVNVLEKAAGQIELYLTYNELLMLIDGVMGTDTYGSNGGTTTGANPYTHVFTDGHEFFNSYTMQLIEGNVPTTKCQRLLGAKIIGATIAAEAAGIVRVTLDVLAKQKQTDQTPTGALTAASPLLALTSHGTTIADGSGDAAGDILLKSFEFSVKNSLDDSREDVGSAYINEPLRNGHTMARMKFRREFRTKTVMDAYIAGTNQAASVTLVSGPSQFIFQMDNSRIVDYDHGVDDLGILYQEAELEAVLTTGPPATGAKITFVNAQATITT